MVRMVAPKRSARVSAVTPVRRPRRYSARANRRWVRCMTWEGNLTRKWRDVVPTAGVSDVAMRPFDDNARHFVGLQGTKAFFSRQNEVDHGEGKFGEEEAALEERDPASGYRHDRRGGVTQAGQTGGGDAGGRRPPGAVEERHLHISRRRDTSG